MTTLGLSRLNEATRLRIVSSLIAGALVAFGLLCWVAANWSSLHRLAKLGLVGGALLLASGIAAAVPRVRIPALIVATAGTGGLLALIGQIYPSGADAWQLFFYWAVLALPLALAARHDAVWSVWALVAVTAIQLWTVQEHAVFSELPRDWLPSWMLAIGLAFALTPGLPKARWSGRTTWAFRVAVLGAVGLVTVTALGGVMDKKDLPSLAGLALLGLGAALLSHRRFFDLGLLAILTLAFDVLLICRIAFLVAPSGPGADDMLLISVVAVAIITGSMAVLRKVAERPTHSETSVVADDLVKQPEPASSWPLAVLGGAGGIVAAVPLVSLYWLLFKTTLSTPAGAATLGALTLAAAIVILRGGAPLGFRQIFGVIVAIAGLSLTADAIHPVAGKNTGFAFCVLLTIMAGLLPAAWVRALLGFAVCASAIFAVVSHAASDRLDIVPGLVAVLSAAAGPVLLVPSIIAPEAGGAKAVERFRPFAIGFAGACLLALMLVAGSPFLLAAPDIVGPIGTSLFTTTVVEESLSVVLTLGASTLLFTKRSSLRSPAAFVLAGIAVAFSTRSPMLGPALLVLACAYLVRLRALAVVAAVGVLWIVSAAYYALAWTLTQKAGLTVGLGLLLGLVLLLTDGRARSSSDRHRFFAPKTVPTFLIAFGVFATGTLGAAAVSQNETVLREGREIFMALRPVDPRSLLQGDYMAIAVDTARLPPPSSVPNREMRAVATVDANGIAALQAIQTSERRVGVGEIAVRVRIKSRRWFVGSDAWYFEEGQGKALEAARFGRFRVSADGRLLLVGLADARLRPIP